MDKVGFGVIGCGDVSDRYGEGAQYCDNTELVVVMDKLPEVAANCGKKFGVPHTANIEDVLNNKDVHAVVVALPHYLHSPVAIQCARAGKHVMCDKPIATTVEDARKMIDECRKAGVILGVNFAMRYASNHIKARKLIADGVIGDVIDVTMRGSGHKKASYWTEGYRARVKTQWRGNLKQSGGGVFIMNYSHYLDVVRFITGLDFTEAYGVYGTFGSPEGIEVEDTLNAVLKFNNGALGSVTTCTCAYGGGEDAICFVGAKGQIVILCDPMKVYTTIEYPGLVKDEWNEIKSEDKCWIYYPLMEDFARAVIEGRDAPVPGEEGRKCLEAVLAVYEAARTGKVVHI